MKLAIGIFQKSTGYELQAAYHDGHGIAIVAVINRQTIPIVLNNIKRNISNVVSDIFAGFALNRINTMAGAIV